MRYPPEIIDQVKARLNIVEEVRKVAPGLKKKGRFWWANCPFHNEKSPSFHVREEGNYYCFGCGAAGDVITFVQETQGGTFNDTIQKLAKQVGVKLPEPERENPEAAAQRTNGFKALERAAVWFARSLSGTAGKDYFNKRSLSEATIETFSLGYAPEGWNNLRDALLAEGFTPDTLKAAGLTSESTKGKGDYDRFRDRVMFPIHDLQNRVVGFGGRILKSDKSEEAGPKYLNSPETPFFNKSHLLYNLNRVKPLLRQANTPMVLVEGYMDVIALWQAGFKTAVAPLGTSVTEDQLQLLWQQAGDTPPVVCLDGDDAGKGAAIRTAMKALPGLEPGKTLQFVWLPSGEDPDSLVAKDGLGAFKQLLANPTPLETVLWQHLSAAQNLATADGRAQVEGEIGGILAQIKNVIVRRHYGKVLKDKLYQATRQTSASGGGGGGPAIVKARDEKAPADYRPGVQGDAGALYMLALVCRFPELLPDVVESFGTLDFPPGPAREVAKSLMRAYMTQKLEAAELADEMANGPQAAQVAELVRSTGVGGLDTAITSPGVEFNRVYGEWYHAKQHREALQQARQTTDWSSPEQWQKFKGLHQSNENAVEADLTGDLGKPM